MNEAQRFAEVVLAHSRGESIEYRLNPGGKWYRLVAYNPMELDGQIRVREVLPGEDEI